MRRLRIFLTAPPAMRIPLLMAALLYCLLSSHAQADDLESIVTRLQGRYETVHELSADFTQANFSKGMGASVTTAGRVYFKKPGMMRWEYDNTDGDLLISDGTTIWLFQADLGQVIESSADVTGDGGNPAHNFLTGMGRLRDDFDISLAGTTPKIYRLELLPKIDHPSISRITINVDKTTLLIMGTTVLDQFGNKTKVTFSGIEINSGLDPAIFTYTPPEGVIVVRPM